MIQDFLNIFDQLSVVEWTAFIVFVVVFLLRFLYLFFFTARVVYKKDLKSESKLNTPLSLLFTLRNEEEHIRNILPRILEIEDLDFEVVVVDDFSQDSSLSVLGLLNQRYGHLKISSLSQDTRFSVKLAQNIALKGASNEWVLSTPIGLSEVKNDWLPSFLQKIAVRDIDLVLGYSSVLPAKGAFNLFYRIENFNQQIKNAGYISNGVPFIYSEDNLAFKKERYFQLGGYGKNIKEQYANLELIANLFIKTKNTELNFNQRSAIRKDVDVSKAEYFDLLNKSYRIEKYLPVWKRLFLFVDSFSDLLFLPALALVLFSVFELWPLILTLVAIKGASYLLIIKITQNRLNERKIFISSLVYSLLIPYCKLVYRWHLNKQLGKQKWKNTA